jgi:hypothetical protein
MVLEERKIPIAHSRDVCVGTIEETLHNILERVESLTADTLPRSRTALVTAPVTLEDLIGSLPDSGPIIICDTKGTPWSTPNFVESGDWSPRRPVFRTP